MADLDGQHARARQSRSTQVSPEVAAPAAAPANPLLTPRWAAGNQAVQRHLRSGVLSRQMVAGLRPVLGNQAVQRLALSRASQATPPTNRHGDTLAEEADEIAGGKNPGNDEERLLSEESPSAGGKGVHAGDQSVHRAAIDEFQQRNPQGGLIARQGQLLARAAPVTINGQDHSSTLRRKGGEAAGGAAPNLTKKTVKGPTSQKYGGYRWVIQWELDNPSPKGGWIVQKVDYANNVKKKDGSKVQSGYEKWVPYWEAWEVKKGKTITTYAENGDVEDDTYASPPYDADTQGTDETIGSAAFYEGLKLPKSMKPNTKSPAGILPFTQSDPGLTGGSTALAHSLKAVWDGNGGDGTTTVTTV